MVAPVGIRHWWEDEEGRLGFHSEIREMIDRRLNDEANPTRPITERWTMFNPEAWGTDSCSAEYSASAVESGEGGLR